MKAKKTKIIQGHTIEEYNKKFKTKLDKLERHSVIEIDEYNKIYFKYKPNESHEREDSPLLANKRWWLINDIYYQVPHLFSKDSKLTIIGLGTIILAGIIAAAIAIPKSCHHDTPVVPPTATTYDVVIENNALEKADFNNIVNEKGKDYQATVTLKDKESHITNAKVKINNELKIYDLVESKIIISKDILEKATTTTYITDILSAPNHINVTGLTLNKHAENLKVGGSSITLIPTITPSDASDKGYTFSIKSQTENDDVISLDKNTGEVKGLKNGTAVVECSSIETPSISDTCTFLVTTDLESLSFEQNIMVITTEVKANNSPKVSFFPETASDKSVKYSISDTSVATVNPDTGEVTPCDGADGKSATVTVKSVKDENISSSYTLRVGLHVTSVQITNKISYLAVGEEHTLTTSIQPENAIEKGLIYSVNEEMKDYVEIDNNGKIKAIGVPEKGSKSFTITVKAVDDKNNPYDTMQASVYRKAKSIEFNNVPDKIRDDYKTAQYNFGATVKDINDVVISKVVTWEIEEGGDYFEFSESNPGVLTSKKVHIPENQKLKIKASYTDDKGDTISNSKEIDIYTPLESFELNKTSDGVFKTEQSEFNGTNFKGPSYKNGSGETVTVEPSSTALTPTSSNENVATATYDSATSKIIVSTKNKIGNAKITVKSTLEKDVSTAFKKEFTITTNDITFGIESKTSGITNIIDINKTATYGITSNAGVSKFNNITWSSSDTSILTIGETTGVVTPVKDGKTKINVSAYFYTGELSQFTASYDIEVRTYVSGLSISPTSVTLNVNEESQLSQTFTASISPTSPTISTLEWKCSDEKGEYVTFEKIDNTSAKVSAKKALPADAKPIEVTVKSTDGSSKSATSKVSVKSNAPSGLSMSPSYYNVQESPVEIQLTTISTPQYENSDYTWSSSDPSIEVSATGLMKIKASFSGWAHVSATFTKDPTEANTCYCYVFDESYAYLSGLHDYDIDEGVKNVYEVGAVEGSKIGTYGDPTINETKLEIQKQAQGKYNIKIKDDTSKEYYEKNGGTATITFTDTSQYGLTVSKEIEVAHYGKLEPSYYKPEGFEYDKLAVSAKSRDISGNLVIPSFYGYLDAEEPESEWVTSPAEVLLYDDENNIGAFENCVNLTYVKIPSQIYSISQSAFAFCYSLTEVNLTDNYQCVYIERNAFGGCLSLASIDLTKLHELKSIGENAFGCTAITKIYIPSKVNSIGDNAFINCKSLKDITIDSELFASLKTDSTKIFDALVTGDTIKIKETITPQSESYIYKNFTKGTTTGGYTTYTKK